MKIDRAILLAAALAAGVAATLTLAGRTLGARQAARAFLSLEAGDAPRALDQAAAGLRWYPYEIGAQYSRLVALKRLGQWDALAAEARRARAWHPDGALVLELEGEADWMTGRPADAAEALWGALWRMPTPPGTPAQIWRVAMLAGRKSWGDRDPRVAAAAVRMLALMDQDLTMTTATAAGAAIRKQALAEAAEALRAAGAPLTAQAAAGE